MAKTTAWWQDATLKNNSNEALAAERRKALEKSDLIAVYFASYYNLPSRIFTGFLKEFYEEVNKLGVDMIFVPMDETQEDSIDFVASLHGPWVVLPWSEQGTRRTVRNMYNIISIPSVVIVKNSGTAPVVSFDGKNDIEDLWTDALEKWKDKAKYI